ncbi:MAG TPA: hypothetical protein PL169_25970, partial [Leptospiraceae bacterium]|nr:hypothetical protein [Leptospiraceae bacterium]
PNLQKRIEFVDEILKGKSVQPYQYRVLKPFLGKKIGSLIPFNGHIKHFVGFSILNFFVFFGIYFLFFNYLKIFYDEKISFIGVLILQILIPLSVSGFYMEGDFITLLFYTVGLMLLFKNKQYFLPVLMFLAALNREQFIFFSVWHFIFLYSFKRLDKKNLFILFLSVIMFWAGYHLPRLYFGIRENPYSMEIHLKNNTDPFWLYLKIIPLWISEIAGFFILAVYAFRKSSLFFRLLLISLIPYTAAFYVKANIWELAKYLPAMLVLIPMALGALTEERQTSGPAEKSASYPPAPLQ